MKKLLIAAGIFVLAASPSHARFIRGSADCPALTVDEAITEIAKATYSPIAEKTCFRKLLGADTDCQNSFEEYRNMIAIVAQTADHANDEVNMAVYQYYRTDIGYGVLVDYRDPMCGRFVWNE